MSPVFGLTSPQEPRKFNSSKEITTVDKLKLFLSKKFIVTILTSFLVPFLLSKGVPADTVDWLIGLVMAYIGGQSAVDAVVAYQKPDLKA